MTNKAIEVLERFFKGLTSEQFKQYKSMHVAK